MYDKTIFEAMACGCLALASNDNLKGQIDERQIIANREPGEVADRISTLLTLPEGERQRLIAAEAVFAEKNSLSRLADALYTVLHG
jgi:glycosyltransferase involved in cell wall biosynthesis